MCVNEAAHVQSRPVPALQVDLFREVVKISETRARQSPAFITHPLQLAQEQETCTERSEESVEPRTGQKLRMTVLTYAGGCRVTVAGLNQSRSLDSGEKSGELLYW